MYGISYDDPTSEAEEYSRVTVPETRLNINSQQLLQLQAQVNPLDESDNYAIELFQVTCFVHLVIPNSYTSYKLYISNTMIDNIIIMIAPNEQFRIIIH